MRSRAVVIGTVKIVLVVVLAFIAIIWILVSRKVVYISVGNGGQCVWRLNEWYSGRCVLSYYQDGIRKGIVRTHKGAFEWPAAAFSGPDPNSILCIYELDNTIAVFAIDLTEPNEKGIAPPPSLSTTVLFSNFPVRACTKAEVAYLKDCISSSRALANNTFSLSDSRVDLKTLKQNLLRVVDMGTRPNRERTGDSRYDAQPQIVPEG